MAFRVPIKVRFYELDPYGHLNHAAYVQYFEVARVEMLDSLSDGMIQLRDEGVQIVVTEMENRFLKPAGARDELIVETEAAEVRRVSMVFVQRLLRGEQVLATQRTTAATVDRNGRPVRIPPVLVDVLRSAPSGG